MLVVRSCGKLLRIVALKRNSRTRCDSFTVCILNRNAFDLCTGLVVSNVPRLLSSIAIHFGERPRRTGQQRALVGAVNLLPFDRGTGLLIDDLAASQQFIRFSGDFNVVTVKDMNNVFCGFGSVTSVDLVNIGILRVTFDCAGFLKEVSAVLGEVAQLERTFRISIIVPTVIGDSGESVRTVYRIVLLAAIRERVLWGSSLDLFTTQFGLGVKFIIH